MVEDFRSSKSSASTIEDVIGNTPLLRLARINYDLPPGVEVFAKAEYLNPGGSVKDRAALAMILHGEQSGKLRSGMTILDATSDTGIAYAMIGAARGYRVKVCLRGTARNVNRSDQLRRRNNRDGSLLATDGAQLIARELFASDPVVFLSINITTTQLASTPHDCAGGNQKRVTHFITGLGTSGTFVR
jgi:cysteine synthase B